MTKLTTERLEYYAALPTKPSERKAIFMYEVRCMARQILAYEQAAKNPVAWVATDSEDFPEYNSHNEFSADCGAGTPLYAAPVLPKQPELVENLKKVMNSWLAMEPKLAFQPEFTDVMMLLDAEAARAQPVIPEQPKTELVDLSQQVEILNRILNWILKELPVPTQKASAMAIRLSSVIDVISDLEVSTQEQEQK
ncbi:hypothetical protein [Hafnia alvei]|uniref:hypothetical protein n=1 Tax=Hafnia alvei TaxID=569 RepID=UPI00103479FB|nr:hypothetical protein [Hafnia alvei]TBL90033.1 hypothetical protein EYY88_00795 [Hafnia alvei]